MQKREKKLTKIVTSAIAQDLPQCSHALATKFVATLSQKVMQNRLLVHLRAFSSFLSVDKSCHKKGKEMAFACSNAVTCAQTDST